MKRLLAIHILLIIVYAIIEHLYFPYEIIMGGDPRGYLKDALEIAHPFNPSHVPFFPFLVYMADQLTFGMLEPLIAMRIVTCSFWLLAAVWFYKLISIYVKDDLRATLITLIFSTGFFYSLACSYFPITDTVGVALFIHGLYLLQTNRKIRACILFALAIITHKIFWIVVFFSILFWWFNNNQKKINKELITGMVIMGSLIVILYVWGSIYNNSFTWIIDVNIEKEIVAENGSSLPILAGITEEIKEAKSIVDLIKLSFLFFVAGVSVYIVANYKKLKEKELTYLMGIPLTIIFLQIILNQYELNSTLRFSRLLIFPLFLLIEYNGPKFLKNNAVLIILIIGMVAFNVMYGDYTYNYLK